MSRETDTPSSGPNGTGGPAYPSGTPPYGTPLASGAGAGTGRPDGPPEERKTETTLTTRVRINIPGSRPIPPVVVRTTVADGEGAADDAPAEQRQAPDAPAAPAPEPVPAEPAAPAGEKTSDWFAPRKPQSAKGGPGGGGTNGAGIPTAPAAGAAPAGAHGTNGAGLPGGSTGAPAPGSRPGGVVGSMSAPGAPRPNGNGNGTGTGAAQGLPGATGGKVAPGHGGGTGSFDVTEALTAGSRPNAPGGADVTRDDLPYFSDTGSHDLRSGNGAGRPGGPGSPGGAGGPAGRGPQHPAGPTTGPVTGDGPYVPPVPRDPGMEPGERFDAPGGYGDPHLPGAPTAPGARAAGGALSDDTAILTPQTPVPVPGGPRADHVSGHTVTTGIPVVPGGPFAPGAGNPAAPAAPRPAPAAQASAPAKPKKKGRSKLVLLTALVVVAAGGTYAAGLLMNHTDVPRGTTVLGLDIGGGTRDDAVKKLDQAFGGRVNKPLKLDVGGKTISLTPENAGLQFDYQATVAKAATSDYNPVSVVGSLFGQKRVIEPVMPVDEEKLQAALQQAGGGSGSVTEGGITFAGGKAVPVYGKAGKAVDAGQATPAIERAYRSLVETETAAPVTVPTTMKQPSVSDTEVNRELKEFAQPAMSGLVTVRTDAAHSIPFGPVSLPKILRFKAVDGKLVDYFDLKALQTAYGSTFEGVEVQGASGKRDILPQDVAAALRKALLGRTAAQRVGVIDVNPT
ncbi:hypothetical protein KUM39_01730 [Streptomyces sp. J2-1]|uniref:hypothetical protein n=1 Tax=Streptomyces corallincola TaxID=2851888 RepID=UPI001C385B1E|nr:hypothetical protein [Streptomyces corallincola]MBV2353090.1 hypothetical protein [Streptomyces corallincola]